jgi:hypothetical protein
MPPLPMPRGPVSAMVIDLVQRPRPLPSNWLGHLDVDDALTDDDFQLALYILYELHYRGFTGVEDRHEWHPRLIEVATELEARFESALRVSVSVDSGDHDIMSSVRRLVDSSCGPSLSRHMSTHGTVEHMREFAIHRSAYQLKEADPHTWALPRLTGRAKAAMVAIQFDEYGLGEQSAMHSELFADTLNALGLDSSYGRYLDLLPGTTLTTVNLVTMLGLHRRFRGALVGHLAVFEMTSVTPMRRYSQGLARLGFGTDARRFYDVHVEADAVHEQIALTELVAGLVAADASLADDVLFGAAAVLSVEDTFARRLLDAWSQRRSSLLAAPFAHRYRGVAAQDGSIGDASRGSPVDWPELAGGRAVRKNQLHDRRPVIARRG